MITAQHNYVSRPGVGASWVEPVKNQTWGSTTYHIQQSKNNKDFAVGRLNKFVVETTGITSGFDSSLKGQAFIDRYGVEYNGQKKVLVYRAGSGYLAIKDNNGSKDYGEVKWRPEMIGGSIYAYDHWRNDGTVGTVNLIPSFSNITTGGDSGSGAFVWDNKEKKWVAFGALWGIASGGNTNIMIYNPWHQATVDALKEQFTHKVILNRQDLDFSSAEMTAYSIGNQETKFNKNKDLSFSGGGNITLHQNLDLGIGGLIFDTNQTYKVAGDGYRYKGAGIDIGKNTVVDWYIKGMSGDDLHKIGEGTLNVHTQQDNNLKIGNGTVVLNTEKTFNHIYLASGAGTVKLGHANALNTDNKVTGVFFGIRGGTLDLNGYSQTFKRIAASDNGAIVTNSSTTKAAVTFDVPNWGYAYHGQFTGNLDVNHCNDLKDPTKPKEKALLVLDGGMNIEGDISVKNATLTFQGSPTTHAIFQDKPPLIGTTNWPEIIKNKENGINSQLGTHYMSNNQASSFEQPDWETRLYKFNKLSLDNASVNVGRNAWLYGDIDAKDSSVNFGGDIKVYRDKYAGNNVTGFDMQQQLFDGFAGGNGTIYYEGDIVSSNSTFDSYMNLLSASFKLTNNSTFENKAPVSLTKLRDDGISVTSGSKLILDDVLVLDAKKPLNITKDESSTLQLHDLEVKKATVNLHSNVATGRLVAYEKGTINVDDWTLQNSNLYTEFDGHIVVGKLKSSGTQIADANLTINEKLSMSDLNPNITGAGTSAWVGLGLNKLTLGKSAKIDATFSNDMMSLTNMEFGKKYTLINANDFIDNRDDQKISFNLSGSGVFVHDSKNDHGIEFEFSQSETPPQPPVPPQPEPEKPQPPAPEPDPKPPVPPVDPVPPQPPVKPEPPKPNPQPRPEAEEIENMFYTIADNPRAGAVYNAIQEHNKNGGLAYQEVAIKDALTMGSVTDGANALVAITERTDNMLQSTARTITQTRMIQPVRMAIDSRLASLRTPMIQTNASQYPVASASGDLSAIGRAMDADALHQSVFVDVSGGYQKDSSRTDRIVSTNFGYDKVFRVDGDVMVVGGAFSVTELNNQDGEAADDGRMYSLTGYVSREGQEGFGFQSYLTAGHLANDRSFIPEIHLGRQTFDEKSWMVMSSNYLKYRFNVGDIAVKPMFLADIGWTHTSGSESTYLKRDSLNDATVDLGVGLELEGGFNSTSWMLQLTARHNVWRSADTVGVNLKNAQGFISYGLDDQKVTTFGAHGMISQRLSKTMMLDIATGATASTDGALGINGNARLRWLF